MRGAGPGGGTLPGGAAPQGAAAPQHAAALLVDVGSTVIKLCARSADGNLGPVERVGRLPDVPPGEQVRALIEQRQRSATDQQLRICSSANGGLRLGILGLTRRHSAAAAARAALQAGGNVVYRRTLGDGTGTAAPAVDVLVLVGGVDGADHGRLRTALDATRLADFPHDVLVWAGTDAPDLVAGLPSHRQAGNVLDRQLRPRPDGLAGLIREMYLDDLVDRKGLQGLAGLTDTPIWPTPAVLGLAADRLSQRRLPLVCPAPFVIVDVGGATTDVFYCAELQDPGGSSFGSSIVRQVFTDLGLVASGPTLLTRLADDPDLLELVSAVSPDGARALHYAIGEGDPAALAPPLGFLSCLFLALRRLSKPAGAHRLDLSAAASFLITGGAWPGTALPAIHRVIAAASGRPAPAVILDRDYLMWAHGIQQVPQRSSRTGARTAGRGPGAGRLEGVSHG